VKYMQYDQNISELFKLIKKYNPRANTRIILKAYEFAKVMHEKQLRLSGEPYIVHPLEVAKILAEIELDDETICASLLHDSVEDTEATIETIEKEFGDSIAEMVEGITKLDKLVYISVEEAQVENFRKMFLAMGKDIRIILIKLADRLHNMRTLDYMTPEKQKEKAKETMEIYAPLANRLGIYSLKWELEDLSFKYLNPEEYHEILLQIDKKREESIEYINSINEEIKKNLKQEKISAEVTGRAKHLYSIYKKMKRDKVGIDQIYDLFALRIFVNSVKDCYASLGIVHELYTPMPGRFKDYISVPKVNMYQSLHTTLIGNDGIPFEVQIRTWDMHRIAEYGIAAHWVYKEKGSVKVQEDKLAWIRESLEWQKEMQDPQDFLKTLKTELFEDEVYVFTPKGEIKVLPKGSIAVDLAYAIHEQVGHKTIGVKINGKMMPLVTKLQNGDIIEMLTSDSPKGPSRDWLKFVKSSSAKNKINNWFKKTLREENIVKGKEHILEEIKRIGMNYNELFKPEWVDKAKERYAFNTLEDMYAAIGYSGISPAKIISRVLEEYRKEHEEEKIEEKIEVLRNSKPIRTKASQNGIVVKGIDNCLVKLSKCCNPLPGDSILGYITKGRGVSVHRTNCLNVNDFVSEEARLIDVEWAENAKSSYISNIEIYANDRVGLLNDIIKEVAQAKANITSMNARATKEKIVIVDVGLEVTNKDDLNNIIKFIKRVDSVYEVKRKK